MRIIKTTLYTFDELTKEAQEKAINNYREYQDFPWLETDMNNRLEELLLENKITSIDVRVRYSFGYSQGDGASFIGDIEWGAYRATITTNSLGSHYTHSKTVYVEKLNSLKTGRDAPAKKWAELQAIVKKIGDELEVFGYDIIESESSDEAISEVLRDSENEFTEDGSLA